MSKSNTIKTKNRKQYNDNLNMLEESPVFIHFVVFRNFLVGQLYNYLNHKITQESRSTNFKLINLWIISLIIPLATLMILSYLNPLMSVYKILLTTHRNPTWRFKNTVTSPLLPQHSRTESLKWRHWRRLYCVLQTSA